MPRPGDKPPTEGGRMAELNAEFVNFANGSGDITERFVKFYTFMIKHLAQKDIEIWELKQDIEALKSKI